MKKNISFILALLVCVLINVSFAQNQVATVKSTADLTSLKKSGHVTLGMPNDFTKEKIAHNAQYYTLYFTVDFNDKTKEATITMVENSERSRQIIERFLVACDISSLQAGDKSIKREDVFQSYFRD